MQCCGITNAGIQCSRKVNGTYCHQHSDIDQKSETLCAVIPDANETKLTQVFKTSPNLTDLEYKSNLDCNCKLITLTSNFKNLEFLTISLQSFCIKNDCSVWKNFTNLIYIDLNLIFKTQTQLFDIINKIPALQHLVIWDLKALTYPNLPPAPETLHTLILKGTVAEPHNFNLRSFLGLKRFASTRADYGLGKFLKLGYQFKHLIVLEIGGLVFEELNIEADLKYLPTTLRYIKIKHILYPDLFKKYLLSLQNLEYLDLQDSFSLNKVADIIPELTNLQSIYVNTINFADLTDLTIKALESAKFRNNWLTFDFSYSDLLKYDGTQHQNLANEIGNNNWHTFKDLFHLSDMTVNDKGWELLNTQANTPQNWLEENEFLVKEVCKCKLGRK
jgi:hypothetical protein